jgi:putative FmdB family regulatory protein
MIYDYQCIKCKSMEELFQEGSNATTVPCCQKCGTEMTRLISAPKAFILKGQGFYKPTK